MCCSLSAVECGVVIKTLKSGEELGQAEQSGESVTAEGMYSFFRLFLMYLYTEMYIKKLTCYLLCPLDGSVAELHPLHRMCIYDALQEHLNDFFNLFILALKFILLPEQPFHTLYDSSTDCAFCIC